MRETRRPGYVINREGSTEVFISITVIIGIVSLIIWLWK